MLLEPGWTRGGGNDEHFVRGPGDGPLAMYADGFRADLAARGYAVEPANRNLRTLAHVSRWMDDQGLSAGQLSTARLEEFLGARRREGYRHALSVRAVMPLIGTCAALAWEGSRWRRRLAVARWTWWPGSTAATWLPSGP
jgi:hypothetical protein